MSNWVNSLRPGARIVILHPNAARQHLYMWEPLQEPGSSYQRLEGEALDAAAALGQIAICDAATRWLIVDEVDRVLIQALPNVLRALLERLPGACLVLASRVLPVSLLHAADLHHLIQFVPVDEATELYDYTQVVTGRPLLEVKSFGVGRVYMNGRLIDSWDGLLPRLLFFYLVDKGMVTRDEIFRTFWPAMSIKEATNVFHVTKRKVNEVLGIDLTLYQSGYYRITDSITLLYDVVQFNRTLQDSEVSETYEVEPLLRDTVRLYQGDFLATCDADWVLQRRYEMRQSYSSALYALGMLYAEQGETEVAENYYLRAFRHHPSEPRYAEAVMHLLPH